MSLMLTPLSILFMRFKTLNSKGRAVSSNATFNSLYEILRPHPAYAVRKCYDLSILFMRFEDYLNRKVGEDNYFFDFQFSL